MFNFNKVFSLLFLGLFLFSFASAFSNLDLSLDKNSYVYGVDTNLELVLDYDYNVLDYNVSDYNVYFYVNTVLINELLLNTVDENKTVSYVWDFDLNLGNNDFNACISYLDSDSNNALECVQSSVYIYSIDLKALDFLSNVNVNYQGTLDLNFLYSNVGYLNLDNNYSFVFKVKNIDLNTFIFDENVNLDENYFYDFNWYANQVGDIKLEVCLNYPYDFNLENNCLDKTIKVNYIDLQPTSITLNSSVSGTASTATCKVKNNGNVSTNNKYKVIFYVDGVQVGSKKSNSGAHNASAIKDYAFDWAPSVTSNKSFKLECKVSPVDSLLESNAENNNYSTNKTISKATTSAGGSGSDSDSEIDLEAISVKANQLIVDKETIISFVFQNYGDIKTSAKYTMEIIISKDDETIESCKESSSTSIAVNKTRAFTCNFVPETIGEYDVLAKVTISGDVYTGNNTIYESFKVVSAKTITLPTITLSKDADNSLANLDLRNFADDLNTNLDVNYKNLVYTKYALERDFNVVKNDDNSFTTNVTLSIIPDTNESLLNFVFYEHIPDTNKFLMFDLNSDLNKYVLEYTLPYEINSDKQSQFYGLLFTKDVVNVPKVLYNSDKGTILYYIAMVILGLIILALIIWLIIKIIKNREPRFNPYKKHKKVVRVEEKHHWQGFGVDNAPKVKYKGGKFKHKEPVKTATYKGWK